MNAAIIEGECRQWSFQTHPSTSSRVHEVVRMECHYPHGFIHPFPPECLQSRPQSSLQFPQLTAGHRDVFYRPTRQAYTEYAC